MNEMTILPRKPTENNKEYSYRVLYYNIMTMKLPPGTSITENEVAEQLNISRTPVHEALTMLKVEYLVDIVPQSGSSVTLINLKRARRSFYENNAGTRHIQAAVRMHQKRVFKKNGR